MNIQKIIKTPNKDYLSSIIQTKQSTVLLVPTKDKEIKIFINYNENKYIVFTENYKLGESTNKEELIENKILPFLLKIYFHKTDNNINLTTSTNTNNKFNEKEFKQPIKENENLDLYKEELKKRFIINYNSLKKWASPKVEVLPIIWGSVAILGGTLFLSGGVSLLVLAGWIIWMIHWINYIEKKQLEKLNNLKKIQEKIF